MNEKRKGHKKTSVELSAVSKVLQTLLANSKSPLSDGFQRWKLWRFWPTVVGQTLGQVCEPVGYHRGMLYIWVKSAARMQEIRFFEDSLRQKVNAYVGREWVRSVRFTMDRRGIPKAAEAPPELREYLARTPESDPESTP